MLSSQLSELKEGRKKRPFCTADREREVVSAAVSQVGQLLLAR